MSSFLAATSRDDLVLIYLACHGAPDERGVDRPLYVLTHDSDLDDIAGTAWPMDSLAWHLRRYVRAERVVIIADTCHSAGMQAGARDIDLSAAVLNRYLGGLSTSRVGIAYLTSAGEGQRSYEDKKWGGGHGVFTWFLLEGLRGGADGFGGRPKDGVVSLGELAEFVRDQVTRETERAQEPVLGADRYAAQLPLSVTGGLDVHQHLELARALLDVGWLVNDPAPFLTAAREALYAVSTASGLETTLPNGTALAGEAFLAAGEYDRCATLLEQGLARSGNEFPAASWLHLGLARAASHLDGAAEALERFVEKKPDAADAPWAAAFAASLRSGPRTIRALLIGVGSIDLPEVAPLAGPGNDVAMLRDLLIKQLAVDPTNVISHVDDSGTLQNIRDGLRALAAESSDDDVVFFYFGGHASLDDDESAPYLVTHDSAGGRIEGISPRELHLLLAGIPAASRIVVIDSGCSPSFVRLFQQSPVATVVFAAGPGSYALETRVGGVTHGSFTAHLVKSWAEEIQAGMELTWGNLVRRIRKDPRRTFPRTDNAPFLIGNAAEPLPNGGSRPRPLAARSAPRSHCGSFLGRGHVQKQEVAKWAARGRQERLGGGTLPDRGAHTDVGRRRDQ